MGLTRIPPEMLQRGGGAETISIVNGFDMAAINLAKNEAGDGGKIFFPAGLYAIDALTADFDDQEWRFERGAILKRTASSVSHGINVTGNGVRLIGDFVLDMNRDENSSTDWQGINANPAYLAIEGDWELKNCPYVGINVHEEKLRIKGGKISNPATWRSIGSPPQISIARRPPSTVLSWIAHWVGWSAAALSSMADLPARNRPAQTSGTVRYTFHR